MSVPKGDRGESEAEFVHTARELQISTIRKCAKFPKRYTFYLGQPMAQIAGRVYEYVVCANSIFPSTHDDYVMRRNYLKMANGELRALIAQMEVAAEMFGLAHEGHTQSDFGADESARMQRWSELAYDEARLIKGVLKRDGERFRRLK